MKSSILKQGNLSEKMWKWILSRFQQFVEIYRQERKTFTELTTDSTISINFSKSSLVISSSFAINFNLFLREETDLFKLLYDSLDNNPVSNSG